MELEGAREAQPDGKIDKGQKTLDDASSRRNGLFWPKAFYFFMYGAL